MIQPRRCKRRESLGDPVFPRSPDGKAPPRDAPPTKASRPSFDDDAKVDRAAPPAAAAAPPADDEAEAEPKPTWAAAATAAAPADAPRDDGDDSDDSGLLPEAAPAGRGFVGSLRARAREHTADDDRPPVAGPVHIPATHASGEVQSEVDFWVQGAQAHATPRDRRPPPAAAPPDPGLVDPAGGWFWG